MHLLYSSVLVLTLVLGLPFWLFQMARSGKYRAGLSQRLGFIPARLRRTAANENCIWIHAVSVGELLAVIRLTQELKKKFPEWRIAVSTSTASGQMLARARFGEGDVFYLPLDIKLFLRPFFSHLRPRLLVLAESEFWMNLLAVASERNCRVAVVNGRISDRSLPRYLRIRSLLTRHIFSRVDIFLAQSTSDAERARQIGAANSRVQVSGNLKFDLSPPQATELVKSLRRAIDPGTHILVCGSTVEGEEEALLPAFQQLLKGGSDLIVLAPRHPERFASVLTLLTGAGLTVTRRSTWNGEQLSGGTILLLDSMGELASIYSLADVAFVGGSLVPRGGHNVLEPAHFAKPIVVGPYTENFRDLLQRFARVEAIVTVTRESFARVVIDLLDNQVRRSQLGARAKKVMEENAGATGKTAAALEVLLWMPGTLRSQIAQGER